MKKNETINNKRIKILMITSTLPRWPNDSVLNVVLELAKNLTKYHNLDVVVLAPRYPGAKTREKVKNVEIWRFKYFFKKWEKLCYGYGIISNIKNNKLLALLLPLFIGKQILAVKKIVKEENITIIHAHWLIPQGLAAAYYKKLFNKNIKIICTVHGTDIFKLKKIPGRSLKKFLLDNINYLTVVSSSLKKEAKKYGFNPETTTIIHNGIDLNSFRLNKNETIIKLKKKHNITSYCLLFVGRLSRKKGVKYLIRAMPKIISSFPEIKLLIIGAGPELNSLKVEAKKLKILKNMEFVGEMPHNRLPGYYGLADIFIGPSIIVKNQEAEGFGVVFLEAMAAGTPIIATNTGGIPDIIKHDYNGILIPPQNSEIIAEIVINLLKNKEKRNALARNGKLFIENNFNWEKISTQYYNLYKKLIHNNYDK